MSEKFLLSDEELSSVVGGLAGEGDIHAAFSTAVKRFRELYGTLDDPNSQSRKSVDQMLHACYTACNQRISAAKAEILIGKLEGYYSELLCLQDSQTAATARDILDTLETSLGL